MYFAIQFEYVFLSVVCYRVSHFALIKTNYPKSIWNIYMKWTWISIAWYQNIHNVHTSSIQRRAELIHFSQRIYCLVKNIWESSHSVWYIQQLYDQCTHTLAQHVNRKFSMMIISFAWIFENSFYYYCYTTHQKSRVLMKCVETE